jgi:hypothetical protein
MKSVNFHKTFSVTEKGMSFNSITPKEGYRFLRRDEIIAYDFISPGNSEDWEENKIFPAWDRKTKVYHARALEVLRKYGFSNPFENEKRHQASIGLLPDFVVLFYDGEEIVLNKYTGESISHGDKFLYSDEWQEFLYKL